MKTQRFLFSLICGSAALALTAQAHPADGEYKHMARIAAQPAVKQALAYIEKNEPATTANTLAINAIPAPTFAEGARALGEGRRRNGVDRQRVGGGGRLVLFDIGQRLFHRRLGGDARHMLVLTICGVGLGREGQRGRAANEAE